MASFLESSDHRSYSPPSEYNIKQLLEDAKTRWLKPAEICEILNNHRQLILSEASPIRPAGGSLFLFDRNKLRYFRKDGHNWRKKRDGKTVREAHEKLKAGNREAIHCYYAHGEDNPSFQRRSYWLLEGGLENIVLVHYREVSEGNRFETSQPFQENSEQVYLQVPSTKLTFGKSDYHAPNLISSPSEVVSSSYNSQEGITEVDSGDEITESIPQGYQASLFERPLGVDSTACTHYVPSLPASGADTMAHPSSSFLANATINVLSQFQHGPQLQTAANQDDPYGSNKDLEGFYNNDQLSSRVYIGEHMGCNGIWPFKLENEPHTDYAAALGQEFRTKPGVQHYKEPLPSLLKEKQVVSSNQQEVEPTNNGLLSPTVSLFMQSIQSEMEDCRMETWGNISKNQDGIPEASAQTHFHTAPEFLFNISDFAPEWSYASGRTKVLVIGSFLDSPRDISSSRWSCKFGKIEVPAYVLQPGILRCTTPSHEPGTVPFCVTCSDGVACSNIKEFEFRESVSARGEFECPDESSISARKLEANRQINKQEQAMLVRLAKFLLTREDKASAQESFSDYEGTQIRNDKLDFLMVDESNWNRMEDLIKSDWHPYEDVKVLLGQTFFKSVLYQWLKRKAKGESVTSLDKHGLGVLHMVAALGYDWAIPPLLAAGFGVNFRDSHGWTALHWAAFYGSENVTALLLTAGAAPGAVTDPTPGNPSGMTASELAASNGHDGMAGYLGEALVTSHFSSLHLTEMKKLSAVLAKDQAIEAMSERNTVVDETWGVTDDDLSMRDSLAAVRNATKAEAYITTIFRVLSFQKKREKEDISLNEFGMLDEEARAFAAAYSVSRGYALEKSNLAATQIQCKYRGYKARSEFLSLKKHVVRIQAHIRGHQARKKYKKILWTVGVVEKAILRWRRKGSGLRGYKVEAAEDEDSDDDAFLKESRKQKEAAFGEAVGRVKQMIQNPEARNQYRRLLEINQKEKGAQVDADIGIFDDDELMSLLLSSPSHN